MKADNPYIDNRGSEAFPEECCPACGLALPELDRYLEGECIDGAAEVAIRDQLMSCPSCQEYAEEYDALTRRLLSGDGSAEEKAEGALAGFGAVLVARILERVQGWEEPEVEPVGALPVLPESSSRERRPRGAPARLWNAGLLRTAAAAVLLLGGAVAALWLSADLREPGVTADVLPRASYTPVAGAFGSEDSRLRWIVDALADTGAVQDSRLRTAGEELRLFGFRPLAPRSPTAATTGIPSRIEWIVDAARGSRDPPGRTCRFFLVPDDAREFIEFTPMAWSGFSPGGRSLPAHPEDGWTGACYRVVMVPPPVTLLHPAPPDASVSAEPFLKIPRRSAPYTSRWVIPASLHR